MKSFRSNSGPFQDRPYYETEEVERICESELRSMGLLPTTPSPVRIDRFIEKRFGFPAEYEEMAPGILGYSEFGLNGVTKIIVSKTLDDSETEVDQRRVRTTMAHEVGHCLLHGHLFALSASNLSLFEASEDVTDSKVLCRDEAKSGRGYDGRWWEYQANLVMGIILLPKKLTIASMEPFLSTQGSFGKKVLAPERREEAVRSLAQVFDVNPKVARIRVNSLYPVSTSSHQLSL